MTVNVKEAKQNITMSQLKSLEVRVNSIQDAQAVAAQSIKIANIAKNSGRSIEILIDDSIQKSAMQYLVGLPFGPIKVYHSIVKAKNGNVLYPLGHMKVHVLNTAPIVKKKPGRPAKA